MPYIDTPLYKGDFDGEGCLSTTNGSGRCCIYGRGRCWSAKAVQGVARVQVTCLPLRRLLAPNGHIYIYMRDNILPARGFDFNSARPRKSSRSELIPASKNYDAVGGEEGFPALEFTRVARDAHSST